MGDFLLINTKNMNRYKNLGITKNDRVGVVIAHPDDEVLMFGLLEYLCQS